MKWLWLLLFPLPALGQASNPQYVYTPTNPNGLACTYLSVAYQYLGNIYTCSNGSTYTQQTGAGTGGVSSVSGTANQIDVATPTSTPALSIDPTFQFPGTASGISFDNIHYADGYSTVQYPGIGVANAAWSSGAYGACSSVNYSNASTAWSVTSNVITVTVANGLLAGQLVIFTSPTFNSGTPTTLTVIQTGLSGTQFEASTSQGNGSATEAGTAKANYLAVGTTTGVTPGTNSAVWYPVQNSGTPTQLDCAFYQMAALAVAQGGNVTLRFGDNTFSAPYITNIGLYEPSFFLVNLEGTYTGYNSPPTSIQAGNSGYYIVTHGDIANASSSPYGWHVSNIAFDANNLATGCISSGAYKLSLFENLYCHNMPKNGSSIVPFKLGDGSPPSGFQGGGYQNIYRNIFVNGQGNSLSSWATVTPTWTGSTFTFVIGGTNSYVNPPTVAVIVGHQSSGTAVFPCTTMGTLTPTYTGTGPYTLTGITVSGFSGCSGSYLAYVPDMSNIPYGIEISAQTDGDIYEMQVANTGWKYGVFYNGDSSNTIYHTHVYGGVNQVQVFDGNQNSHIGEEFDSVYDIGAQSNNAGASWTSSSMVQGGNAAMNPDVIEFYFPNNGGSIQNSFCNNTSTSGNAFALAADTTSGIFAHGGSFGPINVQNGQECDTLTAENSFANRLNLPASTTSYAPLNLGAGTAPSAPVNGDLWATSLGLYSQIAGATVGPYVSSANPVLTGSGSGLFKGYAVDTGSANAYAIALGDTSYTGAVAGAFFFVKFVNASTASSTITINGGSARTLDGWGGTGANSTTVAANQYYLCFDNGTNIYIVSAPTSVNSIGDGNLKFFNTSTNTKQWSFSGAQISASNFRTISIPDASITLGAGLNIPVGTATFAVGTNVTSVVCASGYTCNNTRGTLTIVGGTATTGTIATVSFSTTLAVAPMCFASQNGGVSLFGIGNGAATSSSFTITAGVTVASSTITVNYLCLP
jgi:hypothetical protein